MRVDVTQNGIELEAADKNRLYQFTRGVVAEPVLQQTSGSWGSMLGPRPAKTGVDGQSFDS